MISWIKHHVFGQPQTLTLAGIKAKARKAYQKKLLTAQHPDHLKRLAAYETDDGYRCAIGASLSRRSLRRIVKKNRDGFFGYGCSVSSIASGIVNVDPGEMRALTNIQLAHDTWAGSAYDRGRSAPQTVSCRAAFLKTIEG